jgi:arylsulfatase
VDTPPADVMMLPIPQLARLHSTVMDARNATPPSRFEVKAPANASYVLIVLIDNMGFGQSSAFGGLINMLMVERPASEGLRYNDFHATARSSPKQAALLAGRNRHVDKISSAAS